MKVTTRVLSFLSVFVFAAATTGCALDEETTQPLAVDDEIAETVIDTASEPIEAATDSEETPTEEVLVDLDLEEDLEIGADGTTIAADTISPAYHLFTRTGATCRDHCVANDQYIGSYRVGFSSPYYYYNSSKIYADYYVGASRKQKWEQHRFAAARVDLFCGSSGQYLRKYYGRAKRGREVVRTWICYAGRCRFQGDNVGSMHKGWKH